MTETKPPSVFSAEGGPRWLNPATMKGAILIAAGGFFLLFPNASKPLIRFGLGGALVLFGASDVWALLTRRDREVRAYRLVAALLGLAAGIGLILWPSDTVEAVEVVLAVYLVLKGVNILVQTLRAGTGLDDYGYSLLRGMAFLAFGAGMYLIGGSIVGTLLFVGAVAAVVFGVIMLAYGLSDHDPEDAATLDTAGVFAIAVAWLNQRDLGPEARSEVADTLYFEEPDRLHKIISYTVMLLLSVTIATLAILQDSTAVVIGAMLIAPLMTPIMGTAAAIVNGWRARMSVSLITVAISVTAAIALAWLVAAWAPALVPVSANGQISSRVSPTLLDMAIAIAAGAAGAYATVDDRVSSSLPGVAIAVALVPPLGVVGVTLHAGLLDDAFGAFLLFGTNFVSIILSSVLVFLLTGFAPIKRMAEQRSEVLNVLGTVAVGALLIMIPLGITGADIVSTATDQATAQKVTEEWAASEGDIELGRVTVDGTEVTVLVSGTGDLPDVDELQEELSDALDEEVSVVVNYFESEQLTSP